MMIMIVRKKDDDDEGHEDNVVMYTRNDTMVQNSPMSKHEPRSEGMSAAEHRRKASSAKRANERVIRANK